MGAAGGPILSRPFAALVAIYQYGTSLAVSTVWIPIIVGVAILLPRKLAWRAVPALVRGWGRVMLFICRCRLNISAEAQAVLDSRAGRVLCLNHSSTLDLFVGAAIMPEAGVTVAKREIIWMPLIGIGLWALGTVFVDRSNPAQAYASLATAARRIGRERLQVLIAPEGTRSLDGTLGRFKLGAFHLASQADIPIVPLVLHDCARLWPRSKRAPAPGVVRITRLTEVWPGQVAAEELPQLAEDLREAYRVELAASAQVATPS